jgi:hypothetical protein
MRLSSNFSRPFGEASINVGRSLPDQFLSSTDRPCLLSDRARGLLRLGALPHPASAVPRFVFHRFTSTGTRRRLVWRFSVFASFPGTALGHPGAYLDAIATNLSTAPPERRTVQVLRGYCVPRGLSPPVPMNTSNHVLSAYQPGFTMRRRVQAYSHSRRCTQ